MKLKRIWSLTIHWWRTLRNYQIMEQYIEEADKVIAKQAERIESLELEHEYLQETDKLFHHCEEQKKQLRIVQQAMRNKKDRLRLLEKSNAFLTNEVEKLNKQINELNNQLHHGKEN